MQMGIAEKGAGREVAPGIRGIGALYREKFAHLLLVKGTDIALRRLLGNRGDGCCKARNTDQQSSYAR
jgi:hypothetical protein